VVEEWRKLKYEGYQVSSLGRVKGATGKLMNGTVNPVTGYLQFTVTANRSDNGKQKKIAVHKAVCEAFHGPRPEGMEAAHNDGDKNNNCADNLRWATPSENSLDRRVHGTNGVNRRLTLDQAREIRNRYVKGGSVLLRHLSEEFGISVASINDITRGLTYIEDFE
jgi:hypothetical protein